MASRDVGRFFVRCAIPSIHSLCLLAPSFVPGLFIRSSITLYLCYLLSFTRVSSPSFCRSHAVTTHSVAPPIHRLDLLSSVLRSPPLVSSIVLLSTSLQLTALGHGAVAVQLHLVLLMLERRLSLFLPLLSSPAASGHFAVVLSSLSLFALSIRLALLSSVSASVVRFICHQSPLDAFILRSLVQFLLCSFHLSLVAVFFPIIQVWLFDGHYNCWVSSFVRSHKEYIKYYNFESAIVKLQFP